MDYIIEFLSPTLCFGQVTLSGAEGFGIHAGITVVVGPNGAGKTTLGYVIERGRYGFGNRLKFQRDGMKVRMLAFTDIHSFTGVDVLRYDQRLESSENEYVPVVGEIFGKAMESEMWHDMCGRLGLRDVAAKRINYLSSGELRKLLVVNALRSRPDLLVLDNPYIGLDSASRLELDAALRSLPARGTSVVMLLCDPADIPAYAVAVLPMAGRTLLPLVTDRAAIDALRSQTPVCEEIDASQLPLRPEAHGDDYEVAFSITDGHVSYGDRRIISGLDWTVRRGERWALTGPNGSGKSLLLSMICGDHPQAYANRITLFDRRRGSGESIWEIKDRIGYVCPEMQLYFRSPLPVVDVVAQGLRSALNRYARITDSERSEALAWLRLMAISHLKDQTFDRLSSGEQRMVLLARAFIRQPRLLILDEPLHGLDAPAKQRIRRLTDLLTGRNSTSLIFVSHYPHEIPSGVSHTKTLMKM